MTSLVPRAQAMPVAAPDRPLSARAQRNLSRQLDELVAAGHLALVRQLITDDLTRTRVLDVIGLCTDTTRQLLMANTMLRAVANGPYEQAIVTHGLAFAQATAHQVIAAAYT